MDIHSLIKKIYATIKEFDNQLNMIYLFSTGLLPSDDEGYALHLCNIEFSIFSFYLVDFWVFAILGNELRKKILSEVFTEIIRDKNTFDLFDGRTDFYRNYSKKDNKINEIPHSWLLLEKNIPDIPEDDYNRKLSLLLTDIIYLDTLYEDFATAEMLQIIHHPDSIGLCAAMNVFLRKVTEVSETFQYYIFALLNDYKKSR